MDKREWMELLVRVRDGEVAPEDALGRIKTEPFEDLGYAKPDHHRSIRQGTAEVIYGAGKTPEQIAGIAKSIMSGGCETVLITRLSSVSAEALSSDSLFKYLEVPKIGIIGKIPNPTAKGVIVVATGGTSDIPVAEEAAVTAEVLRNNVTRLYDVGVAGLHRLLGSMEVLVNASVVIAVAGMEGALASVLGGLVDCPVIGVPTSVGYGASFGGLSALLSMLNSCASGVSVVNIDNGFGAGYLASRINHMAGDINI